MYCKSCGAKMPDDAKFCVECGQKVAAPDRSVKESKVKKAKESMEQMTAKPAEKAEDKKKGGAKKALFWIFGIIGGLAILFVVLLIVWPEPEQPTTRQITRADFVGVWQAVGSAEEPDGGITFYDTTESKVFTLIFDSGKLVNTEVYIDGTVLGQVETVYTVTDDYLECVVNNPGDVDGLKIRLFINGQGNLVYSEWGENGAKAAYTVCGRVDGEPEDYYTEAGETAEPAITTEQETLLAGIVPDVEAAVAGFKWEMSGETVDAIPDSTLPSGYPRSFSPVKGTSVYTFNTSAKTLTITSYENGQMTDRVTENYTVDDPRTIIAFKRTQNIDGQDREVSSAYFVSNGILFECEVMDDNICSNFIAYTNIGASAVTVEDMVAGLDRSFESSAQGKLWVVSGESVPVAVNGTLPAGYPRTFDITPGTMIYQFDDATDTLLLTTIDENGETTGSYVKHYDMLNSTYATAFKRTQVIDGAEREVMSAYFISDGVLYECELVDGVDASNYIAYANEGPSEYSPKALIDALAAGLDRNIEASLTGSRWQVNGTSFAAMPNSALPSGYPRFFEIKPGTMVYAFDTAKRQLTLTTYDENGAVASVSTQPYTLLSNTYISAFKRNQNIGGKTCEVMSMYFISDGVFYECEIVGGLDGSNYIAYDRLN